LTRADPAGSGAGLVDRLVAGETVVGCFIKLAGSESVDIAAQARFDFVVVDTEHAQLDERDARRLVRHGAAIGLSVVVRLAALDVGAITRLLEAGAAGIQLSAVASADDAHALRDACRYAPAGRRSISLAQPWARYGAEPIDDYLDRVHASPPLVVGQVEDGRGLAALPGIAAAVDVVFLGSLDLSLDLGVPGRLNDPRVTQAVSSALATTSSAGCVGGGFALGPAGAEALVALGARYIVVGSDLQQLADAHRRLGEDLDRLRNAQVAVPADTVDPQASRVG